MTDHETQLPTPKPSVLFKQLDEGGVLLSTSDEVYFGVNRVGASIWRLLPPVLSTFDDMCQALAREFTTVEMDRIRRDTRQFLRELVEAGLAAAPGGREPGEDGEDPSPSARDS